MICCKCKKKRKDISNFILVGNKFYCKPCYKKEFPIFQGKWSRMHHFGSREYREKQLLAKAMSQKSVIKQRNESKKS
jgi:hypothetical protein